MKRKASAEGVKDRNRAEYGDQYFTRVDLMEKLMDKIHPEIQKMENPTLFDFSAGDGALGQYAAKCGMKYEAMDICPQGNDLVRQGDFLEFQEHANYTKCVVGFNPPFGRGGALAAKFIRHAFLFDPAAFILILPLRPWTFHGFRVVQRTILPPDAFFLPHSKAVFETASVFIFLVRDWSVSMSDLRVDENGPALKPLVAEDTGAVRWEGQRRHTMFVRKVGAYAGQHIYCLVPHTPGSVLVVYLDHLGVAWDPVEFSFATLDFSKDRTPWGKHDHVVCDQDPAPKYGGSNPAAISNPAQRRVGTGFLKCATPNMTTLAELVEYARKIQKMIATHHLATGAPKSINKGVLESLDD